jgi:hypothetical protein
MEAKSEERKKERDEKGRENTVIPGFLTCSFAR